MADANDVDPPPPTLLAGAALFLDFDGTLVELAESPSAIEVPGMLGSLLRRLCRRLEGRIAIVSGRAIADLERYLDCSAFAVAGSHGLEIRTADGRRVNAEAPEALASIREEVDAFAATAPGVLVEEKPYGLAVHYRQAPGRGEAVGHLLERLALRAGLVTQRGKMVVELRPAGADKGDAVRLLMTEPPFAGARPVFMGDDLTDENAFATAASMGGGGVLIGPPRQTAAKWRLRDVSAAAQWLDQQAGGEG